MGKYDVPPGAYAWLDTKFTYHPPKDDQAERYTVIREKAREFAVTIMENCPKIQEMYEAIEQIEKAVFWANASIARGE